MIEEYSLLKWVINIKIVSDSVSCIIGYLITQFVKFHLSLLIYYVATTNYYIINFLWGIIITVIFHFLTNNMYGYVMTHKKRIDNISKYILENINEKNYGKWKIYLYFFLIAYCYHCLLILNIDNAFLAASITQSVFSVIIIESINNNIHKKFYKKIMNYLDSVPNPKIYKTPTIIENYDVKSFIDEKIPTPPRIKYC